MNENLLTAATYLSGGFCFAFLYRLIFKFIISRLKGTRKAVPHTKHRNLGLRDRLVRLGIAIGFVALAAATSWNPILLLGAGFSLFESIFSWCALYALLGKNTCPSE